MTNLFIKFKNDKQNTLTKPKETVGKKKVKIEMKMDVLVLTVKNVGLPNPAVDKVEVIRDAPHALFMVAAVPPPEIIAKAQFIMDLNRP